MAENEKKMNDEDSAGGEGGEAENRGNKQDYNKIANQQPAGTTAGDTIASSRDMGTVGGGSIPEPRNILAGSGNAPGGMNTANSTVDSGSTTGGGRPGTEATSDRGESTTSDMVGGAGGRAANTIDRHANGNLGGRNPSEPQTPMGDQDPRGGREERAEPSIADPMTSRDPSTIKQDDSTRSNQQSS